MTNYFFQCVYSRQREDEFEDEATNQSGPQDQKSVTFSHSVISLD